MKKVLIYNWVQFDDSNLRGGGVTVYIKNYIQGLLDRGDVKVFFVSAGNDHSLFSKNVFYEKTDNIFAKEGVESYSIINSPVVAPAHHSFSIIETCLDDSSIADCFVSFIKNHGPFDEVHIHNIEGLSTKVIEDVKTHFAATTLYVWMHNYHWICPQIELFKRHQRICTDYKEGADCVSCLAFVQNPGYIKKTHWIKRLARKLHIAQTPFEKPFYYSFKLANDVLKGVLSWRHAKKSQSNLSWSDRLENMTAVIDSEKQKQASYKLWREKNIARLNQFADNIIAVSSQVKEVYVKYGVNEALIHAMPIGMDCQQSLAETKKLARQDYTGKLRLAYFGYPIPSKGLSFLIDTLSDLPEEYKNKIHFKVYSRLDDWNRRALSSLANSVQVSVLDGYKRDELEDILKEIDLGVVPSLWMETYNQVSYELITYGVPVLVSDTVGIRELISDKRFIFQSGVHQSLADKLADILERRITLAEFYANQQIQLPSINQNIDKIEVLNNKNQH